MKYLVIFCLMALVGCGECDKSKYYQIKSKGPDNDSASMCRYEADGIGMCTTWQKSEVIYFTDSCSLFKLSQIVSRAMIEKYK
jgi:hypothetical protein